MKKLIFRLIFALVLIPGGVIGTIIFLNQQGAFNLDAIEVEVLQNAELAGFTHPLIENLKSEVEALKGASLWQLDLQEINAKLLQKNWIEVTTLSRHWPTGLKISIKPKDVKLVYVTGSGKLLPIVEDGDFLDPVQSTQAPDVALLQGEAFAKNLEMRKRAVGVMEQIPADGKFSKKNISELRYDSKEGFWVTLIDHGIKVKIGEERVPTKSARVSQVLEYLDNRDLQARVIDANLSKKVLVRLRKDP